MLQHCRIALIHGMAEGFLIHGDEAPSGREELLSLRVIKTGEDYWARWGCVARARWSRQPALAGEARLERRERKLFKQVPRTTGRSSALRSSACGISSSCARTPSACTRPG